MTIETEQIASWLGQRSFSDWRQELDEVGYIILENVLSQDEIQGLRDALQPHLERNLEGRNDFEGLKTNRIYALLSKSLVFAELATHPLAMAFAEADLGESCLLSSCLAINLLPGESVQPWHFDDGHITLPRPRASLGVSAFWTLDDTNKLNGATEVLPGSHLWGVDEIIGSLMPEDFSNQTMPDHQNDPGWREDAVTAEMPAGSLMITKGTLWHRGGANKSNAERLIITPQYCPGWARPLENMMAAVPPQIARDLPARAREIIGYSIHAPFMGYVDGVHPQKLLDRLS